MQPAEVARHEGRDDWQIAIPGNRTPPNALRVCCQPGPHEMLDENECLRTIVSPRGASVISDLVGETATALRAKAERCQRLAPCVPADVRQILAATASEYLEGAERLEQEQRKEEPVFLRSFASGIGSRMHTFGWMTVTAFVAGLFAYLLFHTV